MNSKKSPFVRGLGYFWRGRNKMFPLFFRKMTIFCNTIFSFFTKKEHKKNLRTFEKNLIKNVKNKVRFYEGIEAVFCVFLAKKAWYIHTYLRMFYFLQGMKSIFKWYQKILMKRGRNKTPPLTHFQRIPLKTWFSKMEGGGGYSVTNGKGENECSPLHANA